MTLETDRPILTFVLPAYNEVDTIPIMAERLTRVAAELGDPYEIVWIDDGSQDGTGDLLETLADSDPHIRPIHFARNFGHMAALTAGLDAARATGAVITLDADGQHPPELIPAMVARWKAGAEIVQAVREDSGAEGLMKRVTSKGFYRALNRLADMDLPPGAADFRLLDRQVVDALNELPERVRFMRGLVFWVGFRRELLPFQVQSRLGGHTKYGLLKMIQFALNGITSFSMRPLRISFFMGMVVALMATIYAAYVLWCYYAGIPLTPGWTSLLLTVIILDNIYFTDVFFAIGIASEYLGRIFMEQKHRPVYVIRKRPSTPRERS